MQRYQKGQGHDLKRGFHHLVFLLAVALIFGACRPQKDLAPGEFLLHKQRISLANTSTKDAGEFYSHVNMDELKSILKQKENRRLLGVFKIYLHLYTYGSRKDNGWRRWLKKLGEPPTIYDTTKTRLSSEQLALFIRKKGYFLSESWDTISYEKKKRVVIDYFIQPNEPYRFRQTSFYIEDTNMIKDIGRLTRESQIDPGQPYDEYVLSEERSRIERALKNDGYYDFSKLYVSYLVDSINKKRGVDIEVKIKQPSESRLTADGKDTLILKPHKKYYIQDVFVNVEDRSGKIMNLGDTLVVEGHRFLNHGHKLIRPYVILRALFIHPGDLYSLENIEYTYERLGNLRAFKSININVFPDPKVPNGDQLMVEIDLSPNARQSFMIETEGTNRRGNLGVNGSVTLTNRNTFHGAEILEAKVLGGLEAQNVDNTILGGDTTTDRSILGNSPFNTLEYGFETNLKIPGLWIPRKVSNIPSYTKPTTQFGLSYNHQLRSAYKRDIFNFGFSYNWFLNRKHGFKVSPMDLSFVRIDKAAWFDQRLQDSKNSLLINSYQNHLIAATIFQYEYTNQERYNKNYVFFRTSLESAGNLLSFIDQQFGFPITADTTGDYYTTFGIRYAQYVKGDGDIRLYNVLNEHMRSVYRLYGGVGIAYGNLPVLPFEKSFYGGGSNNNRAWVTRTMGPGGMPDTVTNVDRIGDMKLELNWEFRFDIIGSLGGAFFVDAGNIWLRNKDEQRPLAEFDVNRFYKELAIGSGVGIRFDLSFFIIRLDGGYRIHDPIYPEGERWFFESKDNYHQYRAEAQAAGKTISSEAFRGVTFNLGIGYPF